MSKLEDMSLVELRLLARKLEVKSPTTYKKQELIGKIEEMQKGAAGSDGKSAPAKKESAARKKTASGTAAAKKETAVKKDAAVKKETAAGSAGVKKDNVTEKEPEAQPAAPKKEAAVQRGNARNGNKQGRQPQQNQGGRNKRQNVQNRGNGQNNRQNGQNYGSQNTHQGIQNHGNGQNYYQNAQNHQNNQNHSNPRMSQANVNLARRPVMEMTADEIRRVDSGETKTGILEIMAEGFGFVRCDNFLPGENDVYVAPQMIKRYGLRPGDYICGNTKLQTPTEKYSALLYIKTVNGYPLDVVMTRKKFEQLTPIFPNRRIHLEVPGTNNISMRMMDLISPIGFGQRGMIVSQPKTGKTTLLKQVAGAVKRNHPDVHLMVLLIDERPEEVTDIKESIEGENAEVIYSTFDELPENHRRVSEMVIDRAKRLVEHGEDVMILLDSITRLARAYNLTVQPSGRTLSGGLDPSALHMPKRFFGAARNMREGGSLTILATALVDTGSKMDDVVFEEFKGTGNMELVLDRRLSEKRLFPAIDLPKSSTRRDDLLLNQEELEANFLIRKAFHGTKGEEAVENIIKMFRQTRTNQELIQLVRKVKIV